MEGMRRKEPVPSMEGPVLVVFITFVAHNGKRSVPKVPAICIEIGQFVSGSHKVVVLATVPRVQA